MASVLRLVLLGCLAGGLCLGAAAPTPASAGEGPDQGRAPVLEPIPRAVAFAAGEEGRFQEATRALIDETIQRTFASLGDVEHGRNLLVRRFGVLSAPSIGQRLQRPQNVTETWNLLLTLAALRDTEGAALELKPVLKPLVPLLEDRGNDTFIRVFAALTAGCFPWPEAVLPERYKQMDGWYTAAPGPARATEQGVRSLTAARRALVKRTTDKHVSSSVAAFFALSKMGGDEARRLLFDKPLPDFANDLPVRASLLARAFLVQDDVQPFFEAVGNKPEITSPVRATGALAIAVALLQEQRAAWTSKGEPILQQLKTGHPLAPQDHENVFARGVCAYVFQINEEWDALWDCATTPSSKRNCAAAACQMLAFCELPRINEALIDQAGKKGTMDDALLALALLRAGRSGTAEGLRNAKEWLLSGSRRPATNVRWDPRWYAAIGLLRAFHQGRISGRKEREEAVAWLRRALRKTIDKDATIHAVLTRVLETHGDRIIKPKDDAALYRLPYEALREVQESFTCPHGLLADDPVEACVRRVNETMRDMFGLENLPPNKPGEKSKQPERYLKRYLDHYPYFSRLEFLAERGFRPLPGYGDKGDPLVIDR